MDNNMNRYFRVHSVCMACILLCQFTVCAGEKTIPEDFPVAVEVSEVEITTEPETEAPVEVYEPKTTDISTTFQSKEKTDAIPDNDIELLALVTVAEAEGESEYGKRLVIDTILNRVDSNRFPDTISGVIYQKNQFTSMWNGRADRCRVTDEVRQLVREEMESRTNSDVLFFTAGGYGRYGTPAFQVGDHYFCT